MEQVLINIKIKIKTIRHNEGDLLFMWSKELESIFILSCKYLDLNFDMKLCSLIKYINSSLGIFNIKVENTKEPFFSPFNTRTKIVGQILCK